ncbi:hypothetical protein O7626_30495 [Micromonospora sp. WMMD1102]|uniref:hypothetical protein n=1 Tax=Micromonospora sp. WMMD1102 TaxID=3016105 RepID=UPI00241516DC|nr:hypothetical protein [Micromonospora sp. WMMD1102]MDG4790202.1 hypothetical protein [Micromonospora sp. WMMD1102]
MGRHWDRRGNTPPPGPGTGAYPAPGTADATTEPAVTPLRAPIPTAEAVIELANEVCGHFARAAVARAMVGHSEGEAEHARLTARAERFDALVNEKWPALVEALRTGLPSAAPLQGPAPTAEAVIALANEVCGHFAQAAVARTLAEHSASEAEHASQAARAEQFDALVDEKWPELVEALRTGLPSAAQIERFMPVRPLTNGHVELHVHDTSARRFVVLLTGVQALAVGAHMTAYGSIVLDRIGQKLDPLLPHVKAAPPFVPPGFAGQPATPDGAAGPPPAHP